MSRESAFAALHRPPEPAPIIDRGVLQVVSVLDDFSSASFSAAVQLWPIEPANVSTDLDHIQPDLVFVESAWNGNHGAWLHQLTGPSGPKASIVHLLDEAKSRGIPTVFWNKEDPPHFDEFLPLARQFDHVLTTEGSLVDRYRAEGAGTAGVLQFAASPALHNPRAVERMRQGGICFAGQYFRHKYPERRQQMDMLFEAASRLPLTIYSRVLGGDERYQFPDRFASSVVGSLSYDEMVHEYKRHRVFLNVNSVPESQTMCARRIFELAATKTVVVSPHSSAIANTFAEDEVLLVRSTGEARDAMRMCLDDAMERRRIGQRAWRRVAKGHLYEHRADQIASLIGRDSSRSAPSLEVLLTTTAAELPSALETLAEQRVHELLSGPLRVAVRSRVPGERLQLDRVRTDARVAAVVDHRDRPIDATFVAGMDTRHRYGRDYLADQLMLLERFPVGPIVTKAAWSGLDDGDAEERDVDVVRRGAWLAERSAAERLVDLERSEGDRLGVVAYASDPFSFIAADDSAPTRWEA